MCHNSRDLAYTRKDDSEMLAHLAIPGPYSFMIWPLKNLCVYFFMDAGFYSLDAGSIPLPDLMFVMFAAAIQMKKLCLGRVDNCADNLV